MGPTWGPPGSCQPEMSPMLAPWTLLSGYIPWNRRNPPAIDGFPSQRANNAGIVSMSSWVAAWSSGWQHTNRRSLLSSYYGICALSISQLFLPLFNNSQLTYHTFLHSTTGDSTGGDGSNGGDGNGGSGGDGSGGESGSSTGGSGTSAR